MKEIALISDIHGNWDAFNAILNSSEFNNCAVKIFCGDAVGYYYEGARVLTEIRKVFDYAIVGNHDREMLRRLDGKPADLSYDKKYGNGLAQSLLTISANDASWFSSLEDWIELNIYGRRIGIYHEAPIKGSEYVYPNCDHETKTELFSKQYDILVIGHSHYQFMFEEVGRYIINPGSVGQSRQLGGYADWAILSLEDFKIDICFRSEKYPIGNLLSQVQEFDPGNSYLKEVLTRTR